MNKVALKLFLRISKKNSLKSSEESPKVAVRQEDKQDYDATMFEDMDLNDVALLASRVTSTATQQVPTVVKDLHKLDEVRQCNEALERSNASDVEFWSKNFEEFRRIYQVWLQSRSIRPSTARLESMFSVCNILVPDNATSLSNENLNTKLIVKSANLSLQQIKEYSSKRPDPGKKKDDRSEKQE